MWIRRDGGVDEREVKEGGVGLEGVGREGVLERDFCMMGALTIKRCYLSFFRVIMIVFLATTSAVIYGTGRNSSALKPASWQSRNALSGKGFHMHF